MGPEAWNHSAVQYVRCSPLHPGLLRTREGAACDYCNCLSQDGAGFSPPECCSVRRKEEPPLNQPGVDPQSGLLRCEAYKTTYNLKTGATRSCEFRYALYPF